MHCHDFLTNYEGVQEFILNLGKHTHFWEFPEKQKRETQNKCHVCILIFSKETVQIKFIALAF